MQFFFEKINFNSHNKLSFVKILRKSIFHILTITQVHNSENLEKIGMNKSTLKSIQNNQTRINYFQSIVIILKAIQIPEIKTKIKYKTSKTKTILGPVNYLI